MSSRTSEQFVGEVLAAAGARHCFGPVPLAGLRHVPVADDLAQLLAAASGRLGPGPGVAYDGSQLVVTSRPGAPQSSAELATRFDIARVLDKPLTYARFGSYSSRITIACDLAEPIDDRAIPRPLQRYHPFAGLPLAPGVRAAMLVGPGVVRRDAVDGLRDFARAAQLPVANTWGAKGVFPWDSPHHMGTCGLQARDFELLGLDHFDVVVTSGLDADEARPPLLDALGIPLVDIAPEQLTALARLVPAQTGALDASNKLYERLSAVAQPGYVDELVPAHPARKVALLRERLPAGGVVAAEPGTAGLWVARTFPTTELGSVVVPATQADGIAAAIALCAGLAGRPAVAVVAHESAATRAVVEFARSSNLDLDIETWGDGEVDWSATGALVEAAGPVVAWT